MVMVDRVDIPQLAVGVVDIFVLKSSLSPSSYAGGPGHLLVLPEAEARDANAMFIELVSIALQDPIHTEATATISEEQETVVQRSRSCEDMYGSVDPRLHSAGIPQATEDIPEPSAFAEVCTGYLMGLDFIILISDRNCFGL